MSTVDFGKYDDLISTLHLSRDSGKVTEVNGMLIKGTLPGASVGSIVEVHRGKIWAVARPKAKGGCFMFTIPTVRA